MEGFEDKLTEALYRVTERFSDDEPLKWRLRRHALNIEELIKDTQIIEEERQKRLKNEVHCLARMLKIAASYSYVCRINFETLMKEYLLLETRLGAVLLPSSAQTGNTESQYEYSDRQKKIIKHLEENNGVGVSEIVAFFNDAFSDKTVQRDLNELIEKGIVRGSGDRRWRKYMLC